jgi:AcrR family transcriptional regulator
MLFCGKGMKKEKRDQKRQLILDSLTGLLQRQVYSQITMEDVAKNAGISKGGLRYYFPTKESLFHGLISEFFEAIETQNRYITEIDLDYEEKVFVAALYSLETFLMGEKNIHVLLNILLYGLEDSSAMEIIRSFFREHLNAFKSVIDTESSEDNSDILLRSRIIQVILIFAGIVETIDPINIKTQELMPLLLSLIKK